MRIGVYGGSFDPVHVGHLIAAECCREQAALDRVLFVPAAVPPHKQDRRLADTDHRVAMLTLAIGGHDGFAASTVELDRGGVSYTIDTLTDLAARHPHDTLVLVLGPDSLMQLPSWREPRRILDGWEVAVVERAGLDDAAAIVREPAVAAVLGPDHAARIVGCGSGCRPSASARATSARPSPPAAASASARPGPWRPTSPATGSTGRRPAALDRRRELGR